MKYHELTFDQFILRPIDTVFAFFEKPENLEKITPPRLGFEILSPQPIQMEEGRVIDYELRVMGLPVRWRTLITSYDPPNCFVDEQNKGPYSIWQHTHTFTSENGGTTVWDKIRYVIPLGIIGQLANAVWVRHDVEKIFYYRKKVIEEVFSNALNER